MLAELQSVWFSYREDVAAVEDVTARFGSGELVSVIGPNGAGKSTLLKLLCGVLAPERGEVRFENRPIRKWDRREYAKRVAYLSQQPDPSFPMRARDVVLSGRAPYVSRFRWESREDLEAAEKALELCDARALAERWLDEMSGGERKRVYLARALAADPELILLDEPLASLDVRHIQDLMELLRGIVDSTAKTILLVSHDLNWSAAYSDRIVVMSRGRVVADGPATAVMKPEIMKEHFGFDAIAAHAEDGVASWMVPRRNRS
ncbi:MAG: ABC transporter ATP-binding protein [Thermoanaerobaculia bacterium]